MNENECSVLLSYNLKRYRGRLGLSQNKLAKASGISPNFITNIEAGKRWASPETLVRLANALEIKLHELFVPEEPLPPDVNAIVSKRLEDVSTAIQQCVDESLKRAALQATHNSVPDR
jgi:transcriptional regulator with XRE-family HTH domain